MRLYLRGREIKPQYLHPSNTLLRKLRPHRRSSGALGRPKELTYLETDSSGLGSISSRYTALFA